MSILIRNLPKTYTQEALKALFEPFGEIDSCDLVMDKVTCQTKGFGFVEMSDPEATEKAIATLNAKEIEGQKIRVKWSNQEKKNSVEHIETSTDAEPLKDYSNVWENAKSRINVEGSNE